MPRIVDLSDGQESISNYVGLMSSRQESRERQLGWGKGMRRFFFGNLIIILPSKKQPKQSRQTMEDKQDIEEKEKDNHEQPLYQIMSYNTIEGDVRGV